MQLYTTPLQASTTPQVMASLNESQHALLGDFYYQVLFMQGLLISKWVG